MTPAAAVIAPAAVETAANHNRRSVISPVVGVIARAIGVAIIPIIIGIGVRVRICIGIRVAVIPRIGEAKSPSSAVPSPAAVITTAATVIPSSAAIVATATTAISPGVVPTTAVGATAKVAATTTEVSAATPTPVSAAVLGSENAGAKK